MESIPCVHCGIYFIPRNRKQTHCSRSVCQRARKAAWQRFKMKTDPDYRTQQKLSQRKWLEDNPDYWKRYRQKNPDKAERNRALQHIRNRRNRHAHRAGSTEVIAKMDARKPPDIELVGCFYLVPVIAKMDVSKVNIYAITRACE